MIRILLYTLGLYTLAVCCGVYLNQSHGQELTKDRTCAEYLRICEASCTLRGDLFRFQCLGQGMNPGSERYRCLCADEAFRMEPRKETVQAPLAAQMHQDQQQARQVETGK